MAATPRAATDRIRVWGRGSRVPRRTAVRRVPDRTAECRTEVHPAAAHRTGCPAEHRTEAAVLAAAVLGRTVLWGSVLASAIVPVAIDRTGELLGVVRRLLSEARLSAVLRSAARVRARVLRIGLWGWVSTGCHITPFCEQDAVAPPYNVPVTDSHTVAQRCGGSGWSGSDRATRGDPVGVGRGDDRHRDGDEEPQAAQQRADDIDADERQCEQ